MFANIVSMCYDCYGVLISYDVECLVIWLRCLKCVCYVWLVVFGVMLVFLWFGVFVVVWKCFVWFLLVVFVIV